MCELLFVLNVSMLREFECDGNAGVVNLSSGHEYVRGTRRSGIVSSAADVLGMSMVCGMRGVGGVCEICMCLARGGVGDEWMKELGLGFTNLVGTGGVLEDVCLFGLRW